MKIFYQDDYATIYHGDCREILPMLPKVDLVLTDPPYGIERDMGMGGCGYDGFGNGARRNPRQYVGGWDSVEDRPKELKTLRAAGNVAMIWGGNYFTHLLPQSNKWLVWNKLQTMPTYSDCELAWTNLPGNAVKMFTYNGSGLMAKEKNRVHPTQKPVSLMLWCLGFGGFHSVCDPFVGSGTTLVAAKMKGIKAIGIEREESYCEIAATRLRNEPNPLFTEPQQQPKEQELKW